MGAPSNQWHCQEVTLGGVRPPFLPPTSSCLWVNKRALLSWLTAPFICSALPPSFASEISARAYIGDWRATAAAGMRLRCRLSRLQQTGPLHVLPAAATHSKWGHNAYEWTFLVVGNSLLVDLFLFKKWKVVLDVMLFFVYWREVFKGESKDEEIHTYWYNCHRPWLHKEVMWHLFFWIVDLGNSDYFSQSIFRIWIC